ncbi:Crp/Fnr family transcriptional regulator [Flavobacterium sp. HSC-61S13]|uniref:Crp/Fnr family transcriptional regulator n=1 Tax=Flavobacterium sp. HSC-61S13 TaxID=2910963 RepID=UPI00209E61B3|nr:Crp/Fnr family transcriptional regulator [Flavobacterium sp. HSC-61S13]MCP1997451.1 CRP-like cAMP-binding protein [Flavobacterium sp. HSC-61S13]
MKTLKSILIEELDFSEDYYQRVVELTEVKKIKKKEMLLEVGTSCRFIGFVEEGVLRSYREKNGEEYIGDFQVPGSFTTSYRSFITGQPSVGAIQVLKDAKIRIISKAVYEQLIKESPLWYKFGKYISDSLYIKKCIKESSLLMDSAQDRYKLLLETYPHLEQDVAQYHIASYLGIQPESLSRSKSLNIGQ